MKFRSIGYCLQQGFKNIARNRIFSIASIATMALSIFILGIVYSVTSNISYMVDQMSDSLCVKAFFEKDITDERIESIGKTIKERPEVTLVHFTSADEAWQEYKEKYFGDEYLYLADGYNDDNPLSDSASYEVYFNNASQQDALVKYIEQIDGIRKVNCSEVTADSLTEISSLVGMISAVILIILVAIALFLINNTISIGITVRNDEIKVMRLLGARNSFIRAPFVVEGIAIGVIGSGIPILLIYVLYGNIVSYILGKFSFLSNILSFMPVGRLYATFVPIALILGVGLGLLGSIISLGKHLKA